MHRERMREIFIVLLQFHRRGEHCSPAKVLCCRKAPRVEQSPTPTINREKVHLNFIALSQFHRRGEHCSPAKALCCRKAPRVEQSPAPTINRERVRLNFIAISQFHRRGGAWLRPPLPHPQTRKSTPAPLAGLQCRPLQAKGKACVKNIAISKFHRRDEHCSPAKALCCRKAPPGGAEPHPYHKQ